MPQAVCAKPWLLQVLTLKSSPPKGAVNLQRVASVTQSSLEFPSTPMYIWVPSMLSCSGGCGTACIATLGSLQCPEALGSVTQTRFQIFFQYLVGFIYFLLYATVVVSCKVSCLSTCRKLLAVAFAARLTALHAASQAYMHPWANSVQTVWVKVPQVEHVRPEFVTCPHADPHGLIT